MRVSTLIGISAALRALLIAYGEVQDRLMEVKFTDIDYSVFTDAARYVSHGQSPFLRSTYRYSPLLAYAVLPNIWLTPVFGKVLFASADIIAAYLVVSISQLQHASQQQTLWAVASWLCNPFTATISTRGSCDALVVVMLLAIMQLLLRGRRLPAALLFGLAVHFRIYPIIYAPSIVLYLARQRTRRQGIQAQQQDQRSKVQQAQQAQEQQQDDDDQALSMPRSLLQQTLHFGIISGSVFVALGLLFYRIYGHEFLHEAFLHHLTRRDPRHNFSAHFYHTYLTFMEPFRGPAMIDPSRAAALPQLLLQLWISWKMHQQLPFCWLMQTIAFVTFNKVSTAQYFVWYFCLIPLVLPRLRLTRGLCWALGCWVAAQLHWLLWGYLLEFQGQGVFLGLWSASLVFLAANVGLMWALVGSYSSREEQEEQQSSSKKEQ